MEADIATAMKIHSTAILIFKVTLSKIFHQLFQSPYPCKRRKVGVLLRLLAAEPSRVGSHQQVQYYCVYHDANNASGQGDQIHYDAYDEYDEG
jgi:predicted phosphatase